MQLPLCHPSIPHVHLPHAIPPPLFMSMGRGPMVHVNSMVTPLPILYLNIPMAVL